MAKVRAKRPIEPTLPFPGLPFVIDIPDPNNRRQTLRCFWVQPDEGSGDFQEEYRVGEQWAGAYVDTMNREDWGFGSLPAIVRAMSKLDPEQGRGYRFGFLRTLDSLACLGAHASGSGAAYLNAKRKHYAALDAARDAEKRERDRENVARMNAARVVKRIARTSREVRHG